MKRVLGALAGAAVLFVAGCGGSDQVDGKAIAPPVPQDVRPVAETIVGFGETFTFEDGVQITLSVPERYERPEDADYYGSPPEDQHTTRIKVTVFNGSVEKIDPSLLATGSNTFNAGPLEFASFDPRGEDLVDAVTVLLPQQTTTWDTLWVLSVPGDLVLTFSHTLPGPNLYSQSVVFRGQVGASAPEQIDNPEPEPVAQEPEELTPEELDAQYCSDNSGDPMCMSDEEFFATYGNPNENSCPPGYCGDMGEGLAPEDFDEYCRTNPCS